MITYGESDIARRVKIFLRGLFSCLYRVELHGKDNLAALNGRPAIFIANHTSLLDPPLLAAYLPGHPQFAINTNVAAWGWLQPVLKLVNSFPVDPSNPHALKSLVRTVEDGHSVVIFPEGRLSETSGLMKTYDGPALIAEKTKAPIVPIWIEGAHQSPLSRLKGKAPSHIFPKITIHIGQPFEVSSGLSRAGLTLAIHDQMEEASFRARLREETLYEALCRMARLYGGSRTVARAVEGAPVTYKDLLRASFALGRYFASHIPDKRIGLLIPTLPVALQVFYALQAGEKIPAMLNYTTGSSAVLAACAQANLKAIVTTRRFIEALELESLVQDLVKAGLVIHYLEDIKNRMKLWDNLDAIAAQFGFLKRRQTAHTDDTAVILFTSGSEGVPKAVELSHKNLLSNFYQIRSRVDFSQQDIFFNCLPVFHSFGLMGSFILPVMGGVPCVLYPNPLHYRLVPEMIYTSNATIMFSTDTFLNGYAYHAHPYDFYSMRYIFAGAEKLKESTRRLYAEKFGVRVMQGYGVTETSPVIAVNSAMHGKPDSVGRLLTQMEYKLQPVEGIPEGGRLFVRGPNVMRGYVGSPLADGWHDTGDIVTVDAERFVTIQGRAKRFAKMAGEMVSLSLTEQLGAHHDVGFLYGAVTQRDEKRGEQIVLYTTNPDLMREHLQTKARDHGITPLAVPKIIRHRDTLPLLGTGKIDYVRLQALAQDEDAV